LTYGQVRIDPTQFSVKTDSTGYWHYEVIANDRMNDTTSYYTVSILNKFRKVSVPADSANYLVK
jgi:hypothetical protein